MADLKKILSKLKEEDPENLDLEELSEEEAAALGGGTNISCPNSSCDSGCSEG